MYEEGWTVFFGDKARKMCYDHQAKIERAKKGIVAFFGDKYKDQIGEALKKTNFVYIAEDSDQKITKIHKDFIRQGCSILNMPADLQKFLLNLDVNCACDEDEIMNTMFNEYLSEYHPDLYDRLDEHTYSDLCDILMGNINPADTKGLAYCLEGSNEFTEKGYQMLAEIEKNFGTVQDIMVRVFKGASAQIYNDFNDAGICSRLREQLGYSESYATIITDLVNTAADEHPLIYKTIPVLSDMTYVKRNVVAKGDSAHLFLEQAILASSIRADRIKGGLELRIGFRNRLGQGETLNHFFVDWCARKVKNQLGALGIESVGSVQTPKRLTNNVQKYYDDIFEAYKDELAEYFLTGNSHKFEKKVGTQKMLKLIDLTDEVGIMLQATSWREQELASKAIDEGLNIKDGTAYVRIPYDDSKTCDVDNIATLVHQIAELRNMFPVKNLLKA